MTKFLTYSIVWGADKKFCGRDRESRIFCCVPCAMFRDSWDRILSILKREGQQSEVVVHFGTNDVGKKSVEVLKGNKVPTCPTSLHASLRRAQHPRKPSSSAAFPISGRPTLNKCGVTAQLQHALTSTYSELNFRKDEALIEEDEDPPMAPGPGGRSATAKTGAHEQESKLKIGNRPNRQICFLCLVTSALIVTVIGLSIHVSQIHQSKITSDRNYHDLISTLESKMDLSQRNSLNNFSALNSNLSVLKRMHTELLHQFTEMETKFRSVKETKAQICEFLISRRGQTCPQTWLRNKDRCYFMSTFGKSFDGAREHCSNFESRLLEINSNEEKDFVSISIGYADRTYWIGKCREGNVASYLLYQKLYGQSTCSKCNSDLWSYHCKSKYRFICEKSAHLSPDIPEEIRVLCQHPVGPTSIN
ncbi:uncharacterized protein [Mobula birostris]|uniref:uncharacterized protein n=1 Tax=Mobula birostris TaxID=1983395 RepID=UPI003B281E9D